MSGRRRHLKWDKLDNTGNLFPVIAKPGMSNVYRVAVLLKEEINEELLQKAEEQARAYDLDEVATIHIQVRRDLYQRAKRLLGSRGTSLEEALSEALERMVEECEKE